MTDVSGGFLRPTTTPTPDELFDVWLSKLSGSELKVLLYIVRRTFGFQKKADAISLSQICGGITTREGRVLDLGTGLARSTASAAVKQLEDYGLIAVERVQDEERGFASNFYRLRFRGDDPNPIQHNNPDPDPTDDSNLTGEDDEQNSPAVDTRDNTSQNPVKGSSEIEPGVVGKSNQGSSKSQPALVRKSYPQQTALQETVSQQTVGQETDNQQPPPSPLLPSPMSSVRASEPPPHAGGDGKADSETGSGPSRPQLTLIHPPPATQPSHEPVSQERQRAVAALVDFGVWRARAEQLVDKLGLSVEVVERACAVLDEEQQRGAALTNPGAVLAARLEAGWVPPPPKPPPNPYAKWDIDEGDLAGSGLPVDHRPPLPPVVTASGVEHGAYGWFDELKGQLQLQLARETYDTWLRPAELVDHVPIASDTPDTFTVRLHNVYAKAWIEHRLHKVILRQAVRMLGKAVRLVYVGPEEATDREELCPEWATPEPVPAPS